MVGLPRSTYYRRPVERSEAQAALDAPLRPQIAAVRSDFPAYGYRRVTHELAAGGIS